MWLIKPDCRFTLHGQTYKVKAGTRALSDIVTELNRQAERFMAFRMSDDNTEIEFNYEMQDKGIVRILTGRIVTLGEKTLIKAPKELW